MPDKADPLELAKAVADELRKSIIIRDARGKSVHITITIRVHHALPNAEAIQARLGLTHRQAEVAVLLADRRTDSEIAAELGISWHTVRSHVDRIFRALHCRTRREAAIRLKSPD